MTESKKPPEFAKSLAAALKYHNVFIQTYCNGQSTLPSMESQGLIGIGKTETKKADPVCIEAKIRTVKPSAYMEKCLDFFSR